MNQIPRNSLLLMLVAQSLVILPHVLRLPVWLTMFCVCCGLWRIMVFQGRWSFPGRIIKTLFVLGAFAIVGFGYGTLLGLEPWVGILIVAFALKLLETHQLRDAYTVIVLAYFVALTIFLFEQGIPYAFYVFFTVTVITAALVGLNQSSQNVRPKESLRRSAVITLQAIPLMLILFVLFPRISPLWTVPLESNIARTGVSDTMSPGDIARLVQSDELAFRATFEGPLPAYSELYWRGLVLSRFDAGSQTWTQERPGLYGAALSTQTPVTNWQDNMEYLGNPVDYSIMLEPTNRNWLFSLILPEPIGLAQVGLLRDFRFFSQREIRARLRYDLTSYLDYRTDVKLEDFWRYRYTLLPIDDNPATRELAESIWSQSDNRPEVYLSNVLRHYATEGYSYTLKPPLLSGNTIDQFLMDSRQGFCEHFAGSFVYLMRAVGVPARVVVGYQGGEYNDIGNYVAVYQFDAHAWAEVWLEAEGWVRVDPTSVVSPERITRGLESAVEEEDTFLSDVGLSLMKFRSTLWLTELRLQISAINHYWDAWVVGYTPSVQMSLLTRLLGDVDRKTTGVIMIAGFFGALCLIGLVLMLRRSVRRLSPVDREYRRFCSLLARQQLPRRVGEGPTGYAERIAEARPDLAKAVHAVTDAYILANFERDDPTDVQAMRRAMGNLRFRQSLSV